jgi:hypothetical protein
VLVEATTVLRLTPKAIIDRGSAMCHHDRIAPIPEAMETRR